MKQSNNAIKFLMAQYRAVFKRAFLANLGLAVTVTAGLTASIANASVLDNFVKPQSVVSVVEDEVLVKDIPTAGYVTSDKASSAKDLNFSDSQTLGDGSGTGTKYIANKVTVESTGHLTLAAESYNRGDFTLYGTLTISGTRSSAVLGDYDNKIATTKHKLILKDGATLTIKDTNGLNTASAVIGSGTISLEGSGSSMWSYGVGSYWNLTDRKINKGDVSTSNLEFTKTTVNFSGSGANIGAYNNIKFDQATLEFSGSRSFIHAAGLTNNDQEDPALKTAGLTFDKSTINLYKSVNGVLFESPNINFNNETNINLQSGAKLTLSSSTKDKNGNVTPSKISLNNSTIDTNSGSVIVEGHMIVDSTSKITSTSGSSFTVDGKDKKLSDNNNKDDERYGTIEFATDKTLENYLSGKGNFITKSGATVIFQNEADLGKYTFDSKDSNKSGTFVVSGATTIKGEDIKISKSLNDTKIDSLSIETTNLTLGGGKDFNSSDNALNFGSATTKNVTFESDDDNTAFTLQDQLTLTSTTGEGDNLQASTGSINGDVKVSGSGVLKVDGSYYTYSDTMTLASGSLTIGGNNQAETSLSFTNGALILDNTSANTVEVKSVNGKKSVLDLTEGGVKFSGDATAKTTFTVSGVYASLLINGGDITNLVTKYSGDSGAAFVISGGTLDINGDLGDSSKGIAVGSFKTTGTASGGDIIFSGGGGVLETEGLYLDGSSSSTLNIGSGKIYTNNLGLRGDATAKKLDFAGGELHVLNGITNNENLESLNVSGGKLFLGDMNADKTAALGGGSVGIENLKVSSGSVEFNGSWITKNLESGISNGIQVSKVGNVTADRLTASVSGSVSVEDGGYLTVNGITNNDTNSGSGLSLTAEDAITLGGNMTLGAGVAEDIKVSGDTVTADFITEGAFDIKGGTLQINFDKSVQFSDKALGELKKKLFGNYGTINGVLHIGDAGLADLDLGKKDEDGRYDFSNVANSSDVTGNNVTNNELTNNAFTTTDGKNIGGTVGAIHVTNGTTATIDNTAGFVNSSTNGGFFVSAKGADGKDIAADITFNGTKLNLENGGTAGNINLNAGSTLNIRAQGDEQTNLKSIKSTNGGTLNIAGNTVVEGEVKVDDAVLSKSLTANSADFDKLKSDAEGAGSLNVTKDLTVKSSADFTGDISVSGTASFGAETYLAGNNNFQNVNFKGSAELDKGVTTAKEITLDANSTNAKLELFGGASLNAKLIQTKGSKDMQILVGNQEGIDVDGSSYPATAGYLTADRVDLTQGSILIADPDYGSASSVVAINTLGKSSDASKDTAGVVRGQVVAARNSIIALGVADIADGDKAIDQVKSTFAKYFDGNGSLDADGVGAVLYVAKAVTVANNAKIVVDSTVGTTDYLKVDGKQSKITSDAYIGSNSVLAIDEVASGNQKQAAIQFESSDASLFAETGAKIVLTGSQISNANNLFNDANDDGIKVTTEDGEDLIVESLNGLYHGSIANGDTVKGTTNLSFNTKAARNMYAGRVSNSTAHTLIAYGANDLDWENANKAGHIEQFIHNGVNPDVTYDGSNFKDSTGKILDPKMFELVDHGNGKYTVYNARGNSFLRDDSANHDGTSTETATRLGSYGGAVHAAMQAGASTYNAISGHMGIGGSQFEITSANNSQGSSLWVSPIYNSLDSDGLSTGGLTYGADVDLYGLALGGDYTMSNGLRFGAVFNVGAGDADGNGGGAGVSNDFNYYGFGIYGGYSMNNFSVLADLSYTVVDNDVDANTALDKLTTSFDTTALSLGVTGQYALDLGNQFVVTPHAGLRFTRLDMDDYTIKGTSYGEIAKFDGDSINVFSVPVGITFAKEFQGEAWTVKPSFDLTLTGNFGDDEIEGLVKWNEVQNLTTAATAEVLDSFTYGATVGVSATSGNFSIGAGLNYTGSSNTDEFGINATARFLF